MYYVLEHQKRPDGIVNISESPKQTYASAVSYYHERYSKMVMTELYTMVSLMLVDESLKVICHDIVDTQWHPPVVEEPIEEPVEESEENTEE